MTSSHRVNVMSVTKTVTAVATHQLLGELHLSVNSPVAPWLPPSFDLGDGFDTVTFRLLMNHTSGINQLFTSLSEAEQDQWGNDWDGLQAGIYWHRGDGHWTNGGARREVHTSVMKFPNDIQATLVINSTNLSGSSQAVSCSTPTRTRPLTPHRAMRATRGPTRAGPHSLRRQSCVMTYPLRPAQPPILAGRERP
jgi:Beta-lactamase